jgi:hypothetical protein
LNDMHKVLSSRCPNIRHLEYDFYHQHHAFDASLPTPQWSRPLRSFLDISNLEVVASLAMLQRFNITAFRTVRLGEARVKGRLFQKAREGSRPALRT